MGEVLSAEEFARRYGQSVDSAAAEGVAGPPMQDQVATVPLSVRGVSARGMGSEPVPLAPGEFEAYRDAGIMAATLPLGAAAGRGALATVSRLGAGATGTGALAGGEELVRTGDLGHSAKVGLGAALLSKVGGKAAEKMLGSIIGKAAQPIAKALEARVQHAVLRGAKEATEQAGKAFTPAAREAAKATAKTLSETIPEQVVALAKEGRSPTAIIKILREQHGSDTFSEAATARIVNDLVKKVQRNVPMNTKIQALRAESGATGKVKTAGQVADEIRARRMAENAARSR